MSLLDKILPPKKNALNSFTPRLQHTLVFIDFHSMILRYNFYTEKQEGPE
jgi:hypothetical protein